MKRKMTRKRYMRLFPAIKAATLAAICLYLARLDGPAGDFGPAIIIGISAIWGAAFAIGTLWSDYNREIKHQ